MRNWIALIALAGFVALGAAPASSAGNAPEYIGEVDVGGSQIQIGPDWYRVIAGTRIYDESDRLITLRDTMRISVEINAMDALDLIGRFESRRASDGQLDLIELHLDTEEDE